MSYIEVILETLIFEVFIWLKRNIEERCAF